MKIGSPSVPGGWFGGLPVIPVLGKQRWASEIPKQALGSNERYCLDNSCEERSRRNPGVILRRHVFIRQPRCRHITRDTVTHLHMPNKKGQISGRLIKIKTGSRRKRESFDILLSAFRPGPAPDSTAQAPPRACPDLY